MTERLSSLLLIGALLTGGLVPLAGTAAADSGPVPLGLSSLGRIVADEARGHLFLSPGPTGTGVRVTDLQGRPVQTIDGLPGATGLALTPDGSSLWVAVPSMGLARIDTSTLAVAQRITLPTGQCAGDVAVVGTRLVYGHSCNTYGGSGLYGGIGVVDAVTGASYGSVTSGPFYRPVVATGPAGQVYAADSLSSPTDLYLYDVSGAAPVLVAARDSICSNLRDLSAKPDGSQVVTSCGYPYQHEVWSADKLLSLNSYPSGAYPLAGAWSADGRSFAAGLDSAYEPDVYVYPAGSTTPTRSVDFGATTELLQPRGLAMSADGRRVWAVTRASSGLVLRVLDLPSPDAATIVLDATPGALYAGGSVEIYGGLLAVTGMPLADEVLTVSRAATGAYPVSLGTVTTDVEGGFFLVDTPPGAGSYEYTVARQADGARASAPVLVWSTDTTLALSVSRGNSPGTVTGSVRLSYQGPDTSAGRTISLAREVGGTVTSLPSLTTDSFGSATFADKPPAGTVTYTAAVTANGVHPAETATAVTTVLTATTLTVGPTPATGQAGLPVAIGGRLGSATAGVAGATVSVSRSGCTQTAWTASAATTLDGTWSVTDPAPPVGTCRYTASYAGGGGFAPSTASISVPVSLRATELTLSVVRGTGSTKKLAYVTARLGEWHTNRTVTITAQPAGGAEVTLASGPVDAAGNLTATYQPRSTTTYRARYAGDDWYSAAVAQRTQ